METRELTCIGCPMGCLVTVELDKDEVKEVSGYTCKRGDIYARKEVTNPTRIVTSTVVVSEGNKPRLSVKTANDIPKSKIFDVMKEIDAAHPVAPIHIGDVVVANVCGTGVDVIATGNVDRAS